MSFAPEQIHLAINHIPVIGLGVALLPLVVGVFRNKSYLMITGLALATVCAWCTPLVMATGEAAYERYSEGPIRAYLDSEVSEHLIEHEERAEFWGKLMYLAAVMALVGLVVGIRKPALLRRMAIVAVVSGVVAIACGAWIAESGGKIRRVDFRDATVGETPSAEEKLP